MEYRVAIVGYGYVGRGMHKLFGDLVVAVYDPNVMPPGYQASEGEKVVVLPQDNKEVNYQLNPDFSFTKECDLAVVCVPTMMKENGQCDTSIVEEVIDKIEAPLILIKSTIEPGTVDRLKKKTGKHIVFSPEYMGEGKYFTPMWKYPDPLDPTSHGFMVMGGDTEDMEAIAQIIVKRMGVHTRFTFLTAKEAEVVKYWENIWGAMKVIFSNHMYDCLQALGVSYYKAREGWMADPRVEPMHTAVFKKSRGFSGKCYPKDISAFIYAVEQAGFNPTLLKTIWNLNCEYHPEFKKKE